MMRLRSWRAVRIRKIGWRLDMNKLAGKCVFCGTSGNLSKGHIWPDWLNKILPPTATHHEQYTGAFFTFEPTVPGPAKTQKIKQGHARTRRPRNTCVACNGGWMSRIESSSMPSLTALVTAKACLLDSEDQRKLSALLCLISMRLEFISGMKTTAEADSRFLAREFEPPHHWKIWIAEFSGDDPDSHWSRYCAMQLESSPAAIFGADHCNTQVTTLVIGKFCAHIFCSTALPDFQGYEGIRLSQIWPATYPYVDSRLIPSVNDVAVLWLHESMARTSLDNPR
jgi:hypothetical protein